MTAYNCNKKRPLHMNRGPHQLLLFMWVFCSIKSQLMNKYYGLLEVWRDVKSPLFIQCFLQYRLYQKAASQWKHENNATRKLHQYPL